MVVIFLYCFSEAALSGEKYICAGVDASYQEVFNAIAKSIKVPPPTKVLSRNQSVLLGYLDEFRSNITKTPPQLNPGKAQWMSLYPKYASISLSLKSSSLEAIINWIN